MKFILSSEHHVRHGFLIVLVILLCWLGFYPSAFALNNLQASIAWGQVSMNLLGGLALFLFGMDQMSDALKSALGAQLKILLARLTRNRIYGALTGAFVTAVIQSSSVTTVLVVGFVSAGMMTINQSIGVIMGANVGTTVTAQIVAFNVEETALWMIAIGFFLYFISTKEQVKYSGSMLMGLGLIFFGMNLMGEAMSPLQTFPPFLEIMQRMENPILAILFGAAFTALVQSSSATTAIAITMAGQGLINLEAGIGLAFGANIGTCITAVLATIGKSQEALRAAMVHILFNVLGVLIWLPAISLLTSIVVDFSPSHPELSGTARLAAEVPRQIANAHTVFNVLNTILFLPLVPLIAKMVHRLVPDKPKSKNIIIEPQFLNRALLETPSLALQAVRMEIAHMAEISLSMFNGFRTGVLSRQRHQLQAVQKMDDKIDILEASIFKYLGTLRKSELTEQESNDLAVLMKIADHIETIGDIIDKELVTKGYWLLDENLSASEATTYLFKELGEKLSTAMTALITAIREENQQKANEVLIMKPEINHLLQQALSIQSQSIANIDQKHIELIRLEMSAFENMKRIHTQLKRIAKEIVPKATLIDKS